MVDLASLPVSTICSNLSKAAEKQQRPEEAVVWGKRAETHDSGAAAEGGFSELAALLTEDIARVYPALGETATAVGDRGVKRAITWGEKVTKIQKTLVERYVAKGDALFEGKDLFICEACGFLFVGPSSPVICPICKAPESRFSKVD